jgi:hypothetical protein
MKKAKQYAEEMLAEFSKYPLGSVLTKEQNKTVVDIFHKARVEMLDEISEIIKMRHAKFDRALFPIYEEQIKKWQAICRLVNKPENEVHLKESWFEDMLKEHFQYDRVKMMRV